MLITSHLQFNRHQWATLCSSISMILTRDEITRLKRINKDLSIKEVSEIYLPLSRLLNSYYSINLYRQSSLENFFGINNKHIPYIISIAGSVAVGKSTTSRILQTLLSRWSQHHYVELITTDSFLHPNQILKERNLMKKKGFPQSYDMHKLVKFVSDLKSGVPNVIAPIYSHLIYDVIPGKNKIITFPDILILEGLNVLQCNKYCPNNPHHVFISDFVDFSIYIDAPEDLLKNWYINRFLKFHEGTFSKFEYFHKYSPFLQKEKIDAATTLWNEINYINLKENILPTRDRASLILNKSENHIIDQIWLRK